MITMLLWLMVALLGGAAAYLLFGSGQRRRKAEMLLRLRALGSDEAEVLATTTPIGQIGNPLLRAISHLLWRSGADLSVDAITRISLVAGLVALAAVLLLGLLPGLVLIAVIGAFGWAYLVRMAARRRARIVEQLPAYLEGVIRVLTAGNTLDEALAAAARESVDPIRPLFISIGRQVRLGAPIEAVLMEYADIHRLRELKVMALAAAINRKYGGSLRNVLRSLIQAIRARDTALRELRALTAETRFSAMLLSIIPVALMAYIFLQNPGYYRDMWADTGGRIMLLASVGMQVLGVFVIMRMMRATEGDA